MEPSAYLVTGANSGLGRASAYPWQKWDIVSFSSAAARIAVRKPCATSGSRAAIRMLSLCWEIWLPRHPFEELQRNSFLDTIEPSSLKNASPLWDVDTCPPDQWKTFLKAGTTPS